MDRGPTRTPATTRCIPRLLFRLWLLIAVVATLGLPPADGSARQAPAADWEAIPVAGEAHALFVAADGSLLVSAYKSAPASESPPPPEFMLYRGDDRGATFRRVPLPPGGHLQEVDPTGADVLYASNDDGLHRSADGGATWKAILPGSIDAVSVSPADPRLIYVIQIPRDQSMMTFLRSLDAGASFETLDGQVSEDPLCWFSVGILEADPADPRRVFRAANCVVARDLGRPGFFSRSLERSQDQGTTWAEVADPPEEFVDHLVGGLGGAPNRYYFSSGNGHSDVPSALYRSDDGGTSFAEVFRLPELEPDPDSRDFQMEILGLAVDPTAPDRVYIGVSWGRGVLTSADGGRTFAPLGRADIGQVRDLTISPDGRTLYAATDEGLFRLALPDR